MHGHTRRLITFTLLCGMICCTATAALMQTPMPQRFDPWDTVRAAPFATELEVQLTNGMRMRGRLLSSSDTMLRLSLKKEIADLHRDQVLKAYQLSPKPEELRRMLRNLATITGVAVGMEIARDKRDGFFVAPALGGAFGAYAGYAFGNRMKTRLLIYDATPRQVSRLITDTLSVAQRPRKVIPGQ